MSIQIKILSFQCLHYRSDYQEIQNIAVLFQQYARNLFLQNIGSHIIKYIILIITTAAMAISTNASAKDK